MDLLNQPEFRQTATQVAKNTANNVVKLGAVAATAIFANNVFKTMAKHTIETAQQDYYLMKNVIKNG